MYRILIITKDINRIKDLVSGLSQNGFICATAVDIVDAVRNATDQRIDLVLVEMSMAPTWTESEWKQLQRIESPRPLPIIILLSGEIVNIVDSYPDIADFIVEPWDLSEMEIRIKRALKRTIDLDDKNAIKCGDLVINVAKCEACIDGIPLTLTFKEYELLKFLATNRGRVFSRDALLNEVWGFDYFGGDRTVDVHIRRLRSKIEDSTHTFIDTVRNIGYRFST